MNNSISEKEINGCDLKQSDEIVTNQMAAKVTTNITIPSAIEKVKLGWMKMSGHGTKASSNLFLLDSYQDLIDIDADFTMTGTIIGIPRKKGSYWTIQWENNSVLTKIQNKCLWLHVMKCDNIMLEHLFDAQRRFVSLHPE